MYKLIISLFLFFSLFTNVFSQNINLDTSICNVAFNRDLRYGDTHKQVLELQKFLNSDSRTIVATSGVGSPGQETEYFGKATINAVNKLQKLFAALGLKKITGELDLETRKILNEYCLNYKSGKTKAKNTSSILMKFDRKFSEKVTLQLDQTTEGKQIIKIFLYTDAKIDKPNKTAIICDSCRVLDIRKLETNKFVILVDTLKKKNWSVFVEAEVIKNQYGNLNERGSNIVDNSKFIKKPIPLNSEIFIGPVLQKNQTQELPKPTPKQPYYNLVVAEYNTPEDTDYYSYQCTSTPPQVSISRITGKPATTSFKILNNIESIPLPIETIVFWFDKTFDKSVELFKGFIGEHSTRMISGESVGKHYGKMTINEYALYRLNTITSRFDFTRRIGDYNRVPRGNMCKTNALIEGKGYISGSYIPIGNMYDRSIHKQKKYAEYSSNQKTEFISLCLPEWDRFVPNENKEIVNFCDNPKAKAIFLPEATIRYYFGQDLNLNDDLDIKKIIGTLFELETPSGSCHLGTLWGILPEKHTVSVGMNQFLFDEVEKYKGKSKPGAAETPTFSIKFRPVPIDTDFTAKLDPKKKEITSGLGCLELRKKYNYWDELENDELWNQEFLNAQKPNSGGEGDPAGDGTT